MEKKRYIVGIFATLLLSTSLVFAQEEEGLITAGIARTYQISETNVEPGDIIMFDADTGVYRRALSGDTEFVGIVAGSPLIVIETVQDGVPVIHEGEILVNVSDVNGPIQAGDAVGVSPIAGKGQRVGGDALIVGVARESLDSESSTSFPFEFEDRALLVGSIVVSLDLGAMGGAGSNGEGQGLGGGEERASPVSPGEVFKYVMAALIAIGSIYISFRNFGANIRNSVISVGRNPLAKRSIQGMVILNVVLIILVGGGGIFLSLAILLLPL